MEGESEGLSAIRLYGQAARPGELDLTDDCAPPTRLQEVEAGSGVVNPPPLKIKVPPGRMQHDSVTHMTGGVQTV